MLLAQIVGHVTATAKHRSLTGVRLLIAQPIHRDGAPAGSPQIVGDPLGAAVGQRVMITSDGLEARQLVRDDLSPLRWTVLGLVDPPVQPRASSS